MTNLHQNYPYLFPEDSHGGMDAEQCKKMLRGVFKSVRLDFGGVLFVLTLP